MCGPPNCLICDRSFFAKLKGDRLTQIWTLIWVPLVILWFIYIGFAFDKLANAEQDRSFQVQLHLRKDIKVPSFAICPHAVPLADSNCTFNNEKAARIGIHMLPVKYHDNCIGYDHGDNSNMIAKFPHGTVECTVSFSNDTAYVNTSKTAFVLFYDSQFADKVHPEGATAPNLVPLKEVPSGLCSAQLISQDVSFLYWKRNLFHFYKGTRSIGYELVDIAEIPSAVPLDPLKARMIVSVGDYWETTFKEVQWYSGYDFWYWLGLVGGFSFLLLLLHAVAFFPFKRLIGDEDSTDSYITHGSSSSDPYATTNSSYGSDTSGGGDGSTRRSDSSYGAL